MARRRKKKSPPVSENLVIPSSQVTVLRPLTCKIVTTLGMSHQPSGSDVGTAAGARLGLFRKIVGEVEVLCVVTIQTDDIRTLIQSPTKCVITQIEVIVPETVN